MEVTYKWKSVSDVLDMTIDQACDFFLTTFQCWMKNWSFFEKWTWIYRTIYRRNNCLEVKLSRELSKQSTVLDEATRGLHFENVNNLLKITPWVSWFRKYCYRYRAQLARYKNCGLYNRHWSRRWNERWESSCQKK